MRKTILAVALLAACGGKDSSGPGSDKGSAKPAPPDAPPAPPPPKRVEVQIVTPARLSGKVKVTVPDEWRDMTNGLAGRDPKTAEVEAGVSFTITCEGDCSPPEKVQAQLKALVDGAPAGASQPNRNTGNSQLDAAKLDVAVTDKGDLPDGGSFVVYTVKKPSGITGPYREQIAATCAKLYPKKDLGIVAHAYAPLAKAKELGPIITEACKGFEIVP